MINVNGTYCSICRGGGCGGVGIEKQRITKIDFFLQQTLSGLATGAIYASMALAVVMIYQAIDHFNFAQGEMAMFSTYIAWSLIDQGLGYWTAFLLTVGVSFLGGVLLERIVFAPLRHAPVFSHLILFLGLFLIFNSLAGWLWDFTIKPFPSPFPNGTFAGLIGWHEVGMIAITLFMLSLIYGFFRFTRLGLALQAAAQNPTSARLVGIRVGWMMALGWGLAAAVGAVAGMLIAPVVFLEPNMMLGILIYGFAGAILGGLSSPGGAVLGGFMVGVIENWVGAYVSFIGSELKLSVALLIIVLLLLIRPSDLLSGLNAYSYAVAQTLVQVLEQAGDELTHANIMRQATNLQNLELPMLLPGIKATTGPEDYAPLEAMQLFQFDGSSWGAISAVIDVGRE
jgi:branched-chain amino acid transport system permease protein